jgi:hypothetical protein
MHFLHGWRCRYWLPYRRSLLAFMLNRSLSVEIEGEILMSAYRLVTDVLLGSATSFEHCDRNSSGTWSGRNQRAMMAEKWMIWKQAKKYSVLKLPFSVIKNDLVFRRTRTYHCFWCIMTEGNCCGASSNSRYYKRPCCIGENETYLSSPRPFNVVLTDATIDGWQKYKLTFLLKIDRRASNGDWCGTVKL